VTSCTPSEATLISVENRTGQRLSEIRWEYRGGSYVIESLEHSAVHEWSAEPSTESSLRVSYVDSQGPYSVEVDVYLTPEMESKIRLTLLPGGEVATTR